MDINQIVMNQVLTRLTDDGTIKAVVDATAKEVGKQLKLDMKLHVDRAVKYIKATEIDYTTDHSDCMEQAIAKIMPAVVNSKEVRDAIINDVVQDITSNGVFDALGEFVHDALVEAVSDALVTKLRAK